MKKILRKVETGIEVDKIKDTDAVGIEWWAGRKTIIIKTRNDEFVGMGNYTDCPSTEHSWSRLTKQQYVKDALDQSEVVQAFVFEDTKELLKWFSK